MRIKKYFFIGITLFLLAIPFGVFGQAPCPTCVEFINPLAFQTVQGVLSSVLNSVQAIIVVLSIIFIIVGAILYITSAGNEKRMSTAKGAIAAAVIGLALGIAAPTFLGEIADALGWDDTARIATCDANASGGIDTAVEQACYDSLTGTPASEIALNVLNILLSLVGILGLIMLVSGGIMYVTAAGDEDRIDKAKKIITYAIVGIGVALVSLIAVRAISNFF